MPMSRLPYLPADTAEPAEIVAQIRAAWRRSDAGTQFDVNGDLPSKHGRCRAA